MSKYEVRQSNPIRQRLILAVSAAVVFALVAAGFGFGRGSAGKDFSQLEERVEILNEQLTASQNLQRELRDEAAVVQRSHELDKAAMQAAKNELANVQAEMVELSEELTFYQSLLSPEERTPGLHIQSMQLEKLGDDLYKYVLVLMQVHQNGKATKGQVFLGLPKAKLVTEGETQITQWLMHDELDKQSFGFKFFQRMEGQIQLQAGEVPAQLMIKVEPIGRRLKSFEQLYDWAALAGESL